MKTTRRSPWPNSLDSPIERRAMLKKSVLGGSVALAAGLLRRPLLAAQPSGSENVASTETAP